MDESVRFVARLLEGEKMAALCREFAITGRSQDPRTLTAPLFLGGQGQRPRQTLGFQTPASKLQASVASTH